MRILEKCSSAWPQQDMQKQINALREAFSADPSKPFELKPGILNSSPGVPAMQPSPPLENNYQIPPMPPTTSQGNLQQPQHVSFQSGPMTPPMTAGLEAPNDCSLSTLAGLIPNGPQNTGPEQPVAWNPAPIFEYVPLPNDKIYQSSNTNQGLECCIRRELSLHG